MNTFPNENVLPFIAASEDINASFDKIERELELENQLKSERAEHEKTRAALAVQTTAAQRLHHERQIERLLQSESKLTPKAVATVTQLLLKGDGGELEVDGKGKLREKFGTRSIEEVAADYLRANPHFIGSAESAPTPKLDRAKMTPKEKGLYIAEHGQENYLKLPYSDPRKK